MKSILNTAAAAASLFIASTGVALAAFDVPEPSSIALVGLGVGAAVFFLSKRKKK